MLRAADLVLTLTRAHREAALQLAPAVVRRIFTLTEFAAIVCRIDLTAVPKTATAGQRLAAIVPLAGVSRPLAGLTAAEFDVPDPHGGSAADYDRALRLIVAATRAIGLVGRG